MQGQSTDSEMALGAVYLRVCNLKETFGKTLQSREGLIKRPKQQRIPEARLMTPAVESRLNSALQE